MSSTAPSPLPLRSATLDDRSAPPPAPGEARRVLLSLLVLAGIGFLIYRPAFDAPFIFDDWNNIVSDDLSHVHRLWPWGPPPPMGRCFGTWTFQVNYALHGLAIRGWHVTNLAIHIAAAMVLYDLVRRTLKLPGIPAFLEEHRQWLALSAALLWLVHPLQTQAVTYIVQRYESLMGLCYLLTIYGVLRGATAARSWPWYALAIAAAWAGAGTKEVMISAPLVALLFDWAYLAPYQPPTSDLRAPISSFRYILRRRWGLYLCLFASSAALFYASLAAMFGNAEDGAGFDQAITPWQYLRSQPAVLLHYLGLVFWPRRLVIDYGWPVETSPGRIYGLGAVIVALFVASCYALWRYPRVGVVGIAFFLILAPTSSIIPIADLAFEHRMYLPLASVILLTLAATAWFAVNFSSSEAAARQLLWCLTVTAVLLLSARTALRNFEYRNPIAMYKRLTIYNPQHARYFASLGRLYMHTRRWEEAASAFETYMKLAPEKNDAFGLCGNVFYQQGKYEKAIELYRDGLAVRPGDERLALSIARSEMLLGHYEQAVRAARDGLKILPSSAAAKELLGWLLATVPDDTVRSGLEAVTLLAEVADNPHYPSVRLRMARAAALAELGRYDEASAAAQDAIRLAQKTGSPILKELQAQVQQYQAHQPWRLAAPIQPAIAPVSQPGPSPSADTR